MSTTIDRCAVCRTTVDLEWDAEACPVGHVIVCEGCDWREACDECRPAEEEVA